MIKRFQTKHVTIKIALPLISLLAFGIFLSHTASSQTQVGHHGGRSEATVTVSVARVEKGNIAISKDALGTVTPLTNDTIRTQISGQLMTIGFKESQIVKQGDFLAQIDPRPYQLALAQAEGTLARDEALLKEAELNLVRYKKLVAQDSIATQQLDTQQSLVDQYRGTVIADKAQVDQAKLNLTYCHIIAPISGRTGLRQVDVGNYVQTSDPNGIVTITQLQPISALFTIPEDDITAVMQQFNTGTPLEVMAYDRTKTNKLATGKLVSIDNQVDTTTGTIKLRAQFDNNDFALFPNQFVNINLLITTMRDVLVIPSAAISRGSLGTFVYKVDQGTNTVQAKPIKIGPESEMKTAVLDGLNEGDIVVIEGQDKLRDGTKILIPPSPHAKNEDGLPVQHKSDEAVVTQ